MIRIECNTWEELVEICQKITGVTVVEAPEAKVSMLEPVQPAVAKAPETVAKAPETVATALASVPVSEKKVTRQEVQAKAIALMDAKKQEQLQALLQKYGVPALPSIPEERLAAFMADMEAI